MKPVIEVMGPWLRNKGDGLNLWSVVQHYGSSATLAVSSNLGLDRLVDEPRLSRIGWGHGPGSFAKAALSVGARQSARMFRDTLAFGFLPRRLLAARGLVAGRDVDALLDCSGYAYGDPWSVPRMQAREAYFARLKAQRAVVIMLPQAFGPFRDPNVRNWAAKLLSHCDLIFARDPVSLAHLKSLNLDSAEIEIAPDITHLVNGEPPDNAAAWSKRVCIVPNARMLDRTGGEISGGYRNFLVAAVAAVRETGLEPVLMVHEENDSGLAREIADAAGGDLPIVDVDALRSKGMIGAAYALIGSRYHAIVSALSQGVPTLGTSWSHKYEMLFADYGCPELLWRPDLSRDELARNLRSLLAPDANAALRKQLSQVADEKKSEVSRLWERADSLIDASIVQEIPQRAIVASQQ